MSSRNSRISQRRRSCTSPAVGYYPVVAADGGGRRSATTVRSFSTDGSGAAAAAGSPGLGVEDARQALKTLFGHDDFRDGQVRGVHCCGNGYDVCIVFFVCVRMFRFSCNL